MDDASEDSNFQSLNDLIQKLDTNKISLFRNEKNLGAFLNKMECVKKASNDWVVLLDSDNTIDNSYIDALPTDKVDNCFYLPVFAKTPSNAFDFTRHSGRTFYNDGFIELINAPRHRGSDREFTNTGNYFFNKNTYLEAIDRESDLQNPHASDCTYMLWLCFKNLENFSIYVVPNLTYIHDHSSKDSWYRQKSKPSQKFFKWMKDNIK
jgi:glycosyltransferase involved in cell wall biosynthesis